MSLTSVNFLKQQARIYVTTAGHNDKQFVTLYALKKRGPNRQLFLHI